MADDTTSTMMDELFIADKPIPPERQEQIARGEHFEAFIGPDGELFVAWPDEVERYIQEHSDAYPPGWDLDAERQFTTRYQENPQHRDVIADMMANDGTWTPPDEFYDGRGLMQFEPIEPVQNFAELAALKAIQLDHLRNPGQMLTVEEQKAIADAYASGPVFDPDFYGQARQRAVDAAMPQETLPPIEQWRQKTPDEQRIAPFRDYAAEVRSGEDTKYVEHPDPERDAQMAKDTQTWSRFMSEQEGKGEQ